MKELVKKTFSAALIIFARKPEAGKVKTRLAATLGDAKALEIYQRLLEHTRSLAQSLSCDVHVFLTEDSDDNFWEGCTLHLQDGAHLGERMHHAFNLLFTEGYKKVVIIGSDCPGLSAADVEDAFAALNTHDVAIGPATDGGYFLMGMNILYPTFFEAPDWSHDQVFSRTMDDMAKADITAHVLRTLQDVDEERDVPSEWL